MFLRARISAADVLAWVLLPILLPACASAPGPGERTFVDDLGYSVSVRRDVKRAVSLLPSNSEMVCLLDCERLKGGTRYDRFPNELVRRVAEKKIEIVGGGFDPSLEKIVEIAPDLVLVNGPSQQRVAEPLKNMGFPVFSLYPRDLDGLRRDFLLLGEILGRKEKAMRILADVESGLEEFRRKMRYKTKRRVYLQTWADPIITVGRGSMSHWVLEMAGGINIFADMPFDSGKVGLESIIQRDPEVLIFVDSPPGFAQRIRKLPGWKEIEGVKKNEICFIEAPYLRRTVEFLDGVKKVHQCLFGGLSERKPVRTGGAAL